jgi:hypothetical protein
VIIDQRINWPQFGYDPSNSTFDSAAVGNVRRNSDPASALAFYQGDRFLNLDGRSCEHGHVGTVACLLKGDLATNSSSSPSYNRYRVHKLSHFWFLMLARSSSSKDFDSAVARIIYM